MKHPIIIKNGEAKNKNYDAWAYIEEYFYYYVNFYIKKKEKDETSNKNL